MRDVLFALVVVLALGLGTLAASSASAMGPGSRGQVVQLVDSTESSVVTQITFPTVNNVPRVGDFIKLDGIGFRVDRVVFIYRTTQDERMKREPTRAYRLFVTQLQPRDVPIEVE